MIEIILQPVSDIPGEALWDTAFGFIAVTTAVFGIVGLSSGSLTIGAFSAYMAFLYLAIEIEIQMMTSVAYVSLAVICIGLGFKLIRLEAWGGIGGG